MSLPGGDMRPSVISSIFGAVGRELQQFVLSAAGISPTTELPPSLPNESKRTKSKRKAPPVQQEDEESDHRRPRKRARTISPEVMVKQRKIQNSPGDLQPLPHPRADYANDPEVDSQERTSSPVPTRAASKMPGALYDWSSPEPESQEERHVRFASSVISPPLQRPTPSPEREKGREWPKARHIQENPTRIKHRDLSYIASQASDTSYATPPPSTTDSEDIGISQESSFNPRPPTLHDTYSGPSFTNIRPPLSSGPGSLVPHSRTSSQASQPLTDRDAPRSAPAFPADSFSFSSMSERSVEQDRISALEDEVRKLKEELARYSSAVPPPPPPPPPPPMQQAGRIPTLLQDKGTSSVLANARASLKATPGVPAPSVNPSANMKSTVPAAQMAAFLNEIKAVRLRKVSSKPDLAESAGTAGRVPLPLRSGVLDKLGVSSTFSVPRQRHALSQDSVSTHSIGSSFAASDHSIPSSQTSANTARRLLERQVNRVSGPSTSLVSDGVGPLHEEFPTTASDRFKRYTPPTDGGSSLGGRANSFPNRPTTSGPLSSLSPERPRPPGRGRASNPGLGKAEQQRSTRSSNDEEGPSSLLAPRHLPQQHDEYFVPLRDGETARRPHSTHRSPAPSPPASRSQSRFREPTPVMSTGGNVPSLEAELRKVVRAEVEREFEREIRELDAAAGEVLTGNGKRDSQRVGFMAGGGAGGQPIWMRNGSEDAEGFEVERRGRNRGSGKSRNRD